MPDYSPNTKRRNLAIALTVLALLIAGISVVVWPWLNAPLTIVGVLAAALVPALPRKRS